MNEEYHHCKTNMKQINESENFNQHKSEWLLTEPLTISWGKEFFASQIFQIFFKSSSLVIKI